MGKPKYIETPEKLLDIFKEYVKYTKGRKRIIQKATPRGVVEEQHTPPLSMSGFEVWAFDNYSDVHHYFDNTDNRYNEYRTICSHIKKVIREDQIEGGMVGQYNPSITQRLNGLTEKTDVTTNGDNIGGKIEVEIVTNRNEDTSD